MILMKDDVVREADGSGGEPLAEIIEQAEQGPEILMLMAGATDGMTFLQQAVPGVFSLLAKDRKIQSNLIKEVVEQALAEGKAGMAKGTLLELRDEINEALEKPMKRVSTVDYMANRALEIRQRVFNEALCQLRVVRNATRQDLRDAVKSGGRRRAVLVHGHGFRTGVHMTDGFISNRELERPREKLKALVLDTCGSRHPNPEETEEMGADIAEEVYGFDRIAAPRDIFATPLRRRR